MPPIYRIRRWSKTFETAQSRKVEHLRWMPIPIDHDGDGYTELVDGKGPEGAANYGCWLGTGTVAANCSPRGVLVRRDGRPHTPETVSRITRLDLGSMRAAWASFISLGWLEIHGDWEASPSTLPVESTQVDTSGEERRGEEKRGEKDPPPTPQADDGSLRAIVCGPRGAPSYQTSAEKVGLNRPTDADARKRGEARSRKPKRGRVRCDICPSSGDFAGAIVKAGRIVGCCDCKRGIDRARRLAVARDRNAEEAKAKKRRAADLPREPEEPEEDEDARKNRLVNDLRRSMQKEGGER